jgi:type I restriction enzyme M protein
MTGEQLKELEARLWQAADKLRADSNLKATEYSTPVLGLIFLRFASIRYYKIKPEIEAELKAQKGSRMQQSEAEIAVAKCGFYLPREAQYDYLLDLPESNDIAKAIRTAMELIEKYKPELQDSLPKDEYFKLYSDTDRSLPMSLLKIFKDIPEDAGGDVFGKVYEYFLSEFALAEGQGGGEFFTPTSVVKLMVEVIEPYSGTIFDPACGSGGMFVQSSYFIDRRRQELHDTDTKDLMVYGTEKTSDTVKLARMNLAVNGLRGEIKPANSYYEDPFDSLGKFDFVMANPPFNVDDVNLDRVKSQVRFNTYGIPQNKTKNTGKKKDNPDTVPNANYLWINLFATSLKPTGRAALVMANSASDARNSEADVRKNLIKSGVISGMLTLPKNMFYTVTLPATLWFFDKSNEGKEAKILFVDARNIFKQVNRALREFTEEQIQNIAVIFHLFRGNSQRFKDLVEGYVSQIDHFKKLESAKNTELHSTKIQEILDEKERKKWLKQVEILELELQAIQERRGYFESQKRWLTDRFPDGVYEDVIGLCKAASIQEIEEQDWSLNPGRYVGVVIEQDGLSEDEFLEQVHSQFEEISALELKSKHLFEVINQNLASLK